MSRGFLWKKSYPEKTFHEELESRVGKKLKIRINDNRHTMLSVRWDAEITKVSMHRMFLEAPNEVMHDLATYLKKKRKRLAPSVQAYIDSRLQLLDYSHLLDPSKLCTQGRVYDLVGIYQRVNERYFNNNLNLSITWFGRHHQRNRTLATFGLYYDSMKLIKINRLLDNPDFPEYVVEYVIYHEMLHHVYPSYMGENGRRCIHNKEFKEKEKQFHYYKHAKQWIEENYEGLFHGRS